ncbi:aminotransferase class I/II-fold pyridoxal phosphate-dependent enzyme [Shewanella gaetbuli]
MTHPLYQKINHALQMQQSQGLLRQRDVCHRAENSSLIDFSHNDYLGLANSIELTQALFDGATTYGVGSKASPLVSGYSAAHVDLEQQLCRLTGHQAAMLFCSGYSANSALMSTLFTQADTVIADKLVHASIIDGIQHSGAKLVRFLHNDLSSAERLLAKHPNSVLVTESVFSMDGDKAPLAELSLLCKQHNALMIVDDAHGFATSRDFEATSRVADVQVVTFGKALGCQGAAVLAKQSVINYLVANARHYIYSTALSPANAYVAHSAIKLVQQQPERITRLHDNIHLFKELAQQSQLPLIASLSAIQPVIVGGNEQTLSLANMLAKLGFKVGAIRSPTVPKGSERLRITLSASHQPQQIHQLVSALKKLMIDCSGEKV